MQVSHVKFLRRSMIGLIIIVLAAVGFNYLQTWRNRARIVKLAKEVLSPEMIRSADTIEYSHYENGAVRFKLRAEKLLETRQGKRLLQGIEGSDRNPDGSIGNQIRSERAEYDADRKLVDFSGDVRMDLGSGVQIRTHSLHYDLNTNIGSTDDKIRFVSNRAEGTARGVRYLEAEKALELLHDLDFTLTREVNRPDGTTQVEHIKATSERGYYSKSAGILRFQGNARLESETSSLFAQSIMAAFRQDNNRLSSVICEGNTVYRSAAAPEPRTLQGDRMVFSMSQESNGLRTIDVMGHGIFSSKSGSGEQELRASFIHMTMNPLAGLLERVQSNGGIDFLMKRGDGETLITGEILDALFTAGSSQLQSINVQQNAHMQTVVQGGGREELSSSEIRLSFRDAGGRTSLDRLQADLRVLWNSLPAPRSVQGSDSLGRSLSAHSLTVQYAEGYLQSAKASGNVIISGIPAGSGNQSAVRRLEADAIRFQFYPGDNHLERFDGDGHVQVLYQMPSDPSKELPAREMRTSSSKIQGAFKDRDGSALSVSQWGGFKLQDGARTAASDRCDYDAVKDVMTLSGSPRLSDSNGVTTGEVMSFDRKQELLTVNRSVRTVVEPGGYSHATPFTDSTGSSTPSLITADEMQYWTESSRVRFNGNVQLLSENGQLQAGMMQISGGGDELEAKGAVRHIIPGRASEAEGGQSPAAGKGPSKKTSAMPTGSSILVTCTQLRYSEKDRSIHYEGDVHLMAGSVSISANRLDAVLDEGRKQIESASAAGKVEVRQDAREVRGDRADYYLQPGKFVVSGNLAEITEPRRGKSWAHRLTFFTSDDRILLENP